MKLVSALVGLAALGGVALSTGAASAMPVAIPAQAAQTSNVQQAALVCNEWGHCWHQPSYGYGYRYGYYHPHYWHHWHPHYYGGWGGYGGGWHHWHRHYYGGWGYGGGYGWHHWHHWNGW